MLKPAIIGTLEQQRDAELAKRKEKRRRQAEEKAALSQAAAAAAATVTGDQKVIHEAPLANRLSVAMCLDRL